MANIRRVSRRVTTNSDEECLKEEPNDSFYNTGVAQEPFPNPTPMEDLEKSPDNMSLGGISMNATLGLPDINEDIEVQSDISIVPNSAISLETETSNREHENNPIVSNVSNKPKSTFKDCCDQNYAADSSKSRLNENLEKEIIYVDDEEDDHIPSGQNEGGFIVAGRFDRDYREQNSVSYATIESEDDEHFIARPRPEYTLDDSIEFLDCEDQGLVPTVFRGYVKEFIDDNPSKLGILYSQECGLVLFHASHVWVEGIKLTAASNDGSKISPGNDVSFYHYQLQDDKYRDYISPDGSLRQAAAVWVGKRPAHLLKETQTTNHRHQMKEFREEFMRLLRGQKFLPMSLVRGRGKVEGYISSKVGVIITDDGRDRNNCRVLFHATDVYIFGKTLHSVGDHPEQAIPVGLKVCFDARACPRKDMSNPLIRKLVAYQACAVFAGSWPAVPHPTILPGGPGSFSPCYESNGYDGTYYYLQLSLKPNLDRKWEDFCDSVQNGRLQSYNGEHSIKYLHTRESIQNSNDYRTWRSFYAPEHIRRRDQRNFENGPAPKRKKENFHFFKPSSERKWKPKKEEEEDDYPMESGLPDMRVVNAY